MEDVLMALIFVGGVLMALRLWLYRPRAQKLAAPPAPGALDGRLDRLENAIEAMTIEIERVTEGQRFTTKLLSDMHDTNRAIATGR